MPRAVRQIANTWIPMSDGCRLAARIWLPEDADDDPVPTILEYIPYRKGDATAARDATIHPYFAGHGYAAVRIDLRGSGDSDGVLYDEYLLQEHDDGLEVIAWLREQPWCTGAVGIIGKSWGGFNGLQIAARRPEGLGAIVTVCSTDDRYSDDVHYMGGCVLADGMLSWASAMLAFNARPPDPAVVGDRWRELWFERLEKSPPFIDAWLSHQRRDDYWKHGSVCEDFAAIECPVYAVGGWTDGYTDPVLRLLAGLPPTTPRKGLIGPWGHHYPHDASPGPTIGFLQECLRWWGRWLKGEDTGIDDEPVLRVWLQDSVEPRTQYAYRPGRWVTETVWPPAEDARRTFVLNRDRLDDDAGEEAVLEIRGVQSTGLDAGLWSSWGKPSDLPPDQRREDGLSLCFDSEPLEEQLEILGFPETLLELTADRPLALVAVRLCDVAPDGSSAHVTRGVLNLTHRDSHEHPEPLEPGRPYTVRVRMHAAGHAFAPGHRVRLAVSPTYWPQAWPSPETVTLSLRVGGESRLELPVRAARTGEPEPPAFGPPEAAPPLASDGATQGSGDRVVTREIATGLSRLTVELDLFGSRRLPDGLEYGETGRDTFEIVDDDPLSATARSTWSVALARGEWRTRVEIESTMTSDATTFLVTNLLEAYEAATRVFTRTWTSAIPRDLL